MEKSYNGIVIFGEMGAGKDIFAEFICSLREKATIYKMSVLCREMMKVCKVNLQWRGLERNIGQTIADRFRELDINIMCDYLLALIYEKGQNEYGWDNSGLEGEAYNKALLEQLSIITKQELPIIVGGRTYTDLLYWKSKNYLIVGIKASNGVRKKRLMTRDGETTAKNSNSKHNTEMEVPIILNNHCDETIINDGTLEDLKELAEKFLIKYNF